MYLDRLGTQESAKERTGTVSIRLLSQGSARRTYPDRLLSQGSARRTYLHADGGQFEVGHTARVRIYNPLYKIGNLRMGCKPQSADIRVLRERRDPHYKNHISMR